jgi:hypothetical protein
MPHGHTFRTVSHRASAKCDLIIHDMFWIIPNPGSQWRETLLLDSICTIPFHARASEVKIPKLRQDSSSYIILCLINDIGTFRGTRDAQNKNPFALYTCLAEMFLYSTNREIQRRGMLIRQKIVPVGVIE